MIQATPRLDWPAALDGYQWIDAYLANEDWSLPDKPTRVLVRVNRDDNAPVRWVQPFAAKVDFSAIFQELAACPPTEEGILNFAERFGTLSNGGIAVPLHLAKAKLPTPKKNEQTRTTDRPGNLMDPKIVRWVVLWKQWEAAGAMEGDGIEAWKNEIEHLRVLVGLWEALKSRDDAALVSMLGFKKGKVSAQYLISTPVASIRYVSDAKDSLNVEEAARSVLWEHLSTRIARGYALDLYSDRKTGALGFAVNPSNLVDAIWLQFAIAVTENREFRRCDVCGKFFKVSPEIAQTHRKLCSGACKQKAHRHRFAKAREMADSGLKPEKIAKEIGSDVKTVKRWLKQHKDE